MSVGIYTIWSRPLFRDVTAAILTHPDIKWVGDSSNMETAAAESAVLNPDIILVEDEQMIITVLSTFTPGERVTLICMNMDNDNLILHHQEKHTISDIGEIQEIILNISR